MDKALKLARLLAAVAEIVMASVITKQTFDTISERRKAKETTNDGKTADAVPESNTITNV